MVASSAHVRRGAAGFVAKEGQERKKKRLRSKTPVAGIGFFSQKEKPMDKRLFAFAVSSSLVFAASASAQPRAFAVRNDGGSRIQFVSDAPLEVITGVTSGVTGEFTVDPADVSTTTGRVQVAVASLRTGVDLRDEHLRGASWLDAEHHPDATFEITRIESRGPIRPNRATTVRVKGRFTLHGVTHEISTTARVRYLPLTPELAQAPGINGDMLRIQTSFSIRLADFNVSVPLPVQLKVSDTIQVNVDLRAVAPPAAAPAPAATN